MKRKTMERVRHRMRGTVALKIAAYYATFVHNGKAVLAGEEPKVECVSRESCEVTIQVDWPERKSAEDRLQAVHRIRHDLAARARNHGTPCAVDVRMEFNDQANAASASPPQEISSSSSCGRVENLIVHGEETYIDADVVSLFLVPMYLAEQITKAKQSPSAEMVTSSEGTGGASRGADLNLQLGRLKFGDNVVAELDKCRSFDKVQKSEVNEGTSGSLDESSRGGALEEIDLWLERGGPFGHRKAQIAMALRLLVAADVFPGGVFFGDTKSRRFPLEGHYGLAQTLRQKSHHWIQSILNGQIPRAKQRRYHEDSFYDARRNELLYCATAVVLFTMCATYFRYSILKLRSPREMLLQGRNSGTVQQEAEQTIEVAMREIDSRLHRSPRDRPDKPIMEDME
ncbi:unnamed protein product [Amoebophrya sp. A120]|nr:unnamed protein product [Amoebophrya sp. A120]|eukprot:GSA120T00002377001.1